MIGLYLIFLMSLSMSIGYLIGQHHGMQTSARFEELSRALDNMERRSNDYLNSNETINNLKGKQ